MRISDWSSDVCASDLVYIDPKPGHRSIQLNRHGEAEDAPSGADAPLPSFFRTIFGALSDIPREQPIRDNLDAIDRHSARIRRMARILNALRPGIEAEVESAIGGKIGRASCRERVCQYV